MKKFCFVLIALLMVGLFPATAITANAEHVHVAGDWWINDDTGHWNQCIGDGNCQEKLNYQKHDTSVYEKYCEVCKNRIDHVCHNPEATCEIGGRCIYCPYGAPVNPDKHNTYGTMIDDKTHKIVCDCGYVKVASEAHVLNSWDDIEGQPGMEESWCEVCFHAVTRKKQTSTSGNSNTGNGGNNTTSNSDNKNNTTGNGGNNTTGNSDNKNNTTGNSGNNNSTTGNSGSNGNSGNSGNDGNNSGNGNSNEQSSVPNLESNGNVQPETSSPTETDGATDGSTGTESETDNNDGNTNGDKDNGKGGSLLWLWILLIIIAVGGTVTAVVLVKKKKQ